MNKKLQFFLLVAGAAWCATPTRAALLVINGATDDTTIFQNPANNASGGGNGLFAGTTGMTSPRRSLINFDVAAALPANAVVEGVELSLTLAQAAGMATSGNQTIALHRLNATADWGEGSVLAMNPKTDSPGSQGQGAAAGVGDATWNARHFSPTTPTLWSTPGGDFAATPSATAVVGATTNVPYLWSSTAALIADVQAWLASPNGNNGWLLKNVDEATATNFRAFYSSDVATAAFFPKLSITYSVPEPSTPAICTAIALGRTAARRRFLTKSGAE